MPKSTVHRWWCEQLALADITEKGVERGMNMHRARHTFATELRRDSKDLGIVQRMLGHDDIHTTESYYGHYDMSDLEAAMEKFAKERGQ
jgi:integrase/recombinase XerD